MEAAPEDHQRQHRQARAVRRPVSLVRPTFLPLAIKNSGLALEQALPQVVRGKPQLADFLYVCTCFRRLAAGNLLVSGDARPFFAYLFKSSRAFVHFLQVAAPDRKLTSKSEPFFDAVACRDDEGATLIARHSSSTVALGREYEEDYYYPRFLMDRFFLK